MADNDYTKGGSVPSEPTAPTAPTAIIIDINGDGTNEVDWNNTILTGATLSIAITSTGCSFSITYDGGASYTPSPWTYSGAATFAGFSVTNGATTPDSGFAVGDTYTQSVAAGGSIYLILYVVEESAPADPVQYITTDQELTSIADAIRTKGGTSAQLVYPQGFVTAINNISTGSGNVQSSKSYTVGASGNVTISPDSGYDTMAAVALSVPEGSAGTPSATKGTVSNHAISVTPSVTNTTGWITGGTKSGTAVSVSASELVSGNKAITSNGSNIDVTNYATVSVNVSGGSGGSIPSNLSAFVIYTSTSPSSSTPCYAYFFETGMTWQEFVESDYNDGSFIIYYNQIQHNGYGVTPLYGSSTNPGALAYEYTIPK